MPRNGFDRNKDAMPCNCPQMGARRRWHGGRKFGRTAPDASDQDDPEPLSCPVLPGIAVLRRLCDNPPSWGRHDACMERIDLLIGFLAFGAAVMTLGAWLWSSLTQGDS